MRGHWYSSLRNMVIQIHFGVSKKLILVLHCQNHHGKLLCCTHVTRPTLYRGGTRTGQTRYKNSLNSGKLFKLDLILDLHATAGAQICPVLLMLINFMLFSSCIWCSDIVFVVSNGPVPVKQNGPLSSSSLNCLWEPGCATSVLQCFAVASKR